MTQKRYTLIIHDYSTYVPTLVIRLESLPADELLQKLPSEDATFVAEMIQSDDTASISVFNGMRYSLFQTT